MRAMIVVLLCGAATAGCSSDDSPGKDGQAGGDRGSVAGDRGTAADQGVGGGDQGGAVGPHGSCAIDAGGKQRCVEYVGSSFAPAAALDAVRGACSQSSGAWSDAGCSQEGMQGYCTWLEGQPTEERHYFYNYPVDDLNQEKIACESVDGHRWHRL